MKKILSYLLIVIFSISIINAQNLPSVNVKTLDREVFNIQDIENNGAPIVISFLGNVVQTMHKRIK